MSHLDWPKAINDIKLIKDHFSKTSKSVSVVGFCMGGALTIASLASIEGFKAGGVFYGIPDLNVFRLNQITANVIAHFGSLDPLKGFSDIETALRLKHDCLTHRYPIKVKYNLFIK
jgi:carboxymethylenebutenolidase